MVDLTVVILTKNEEKNLRKCIESFCGIVKRFVIVDSFSTDGTEALCKQLDSELRANGSQLDFYQNKWMDYATQLNWGLTQTNITTEWSMRFDSDEELTEELVNEIEQKLPDVKEPVNGIILRRRVYCRKLFEEKNYDTSYKILADREYLMWIVCSKRISPCYLDFLIVNYQADGACENEKYREQNKKDIQRMNETYLSNFEQTKFKILHCLTLPRLRSLISSSPKLGKIYMKSVDMIYRAMSKNSR